MRLAPAPVRVRAPICVPARTRAGFTLIEMMITVALIAILAKVAVPGYLEYVKRGKLTEAFNQLSAYGLTLEQYYQDNRTYATACVATSTAPAPATTAYFSYSCSGLSATGYTVTATGVSGSATAGFAFTMTQSGARATTAAPSGWPTSTTCWVSSKSGSCQ